MDKHKKQKETNVHSKIDDIKLFQSQHHTKWEMQHHHLKTTKYSFPETIRYRQDYLVEYWLEWTLVYNIGHLWWEWTAERNVRI